MKAKKQTQLPVQAEQQNSNRRRRYRRSSTSTTRLDDVLRAHLIIYL